MFLNREKFDKAMALVSRAARPDMMDDLDLIPFKWAETLSQGEQDVVLASSLKRLQTMIIEAFSTHPNEAQPGEHPASAKNLLRVTEEINSIVREGGPEFQSQWHDMMQSAKGVDGITEAQKCVNCHHELLPEMSLDSSGRCIVRISTPDGDANECGCKCQLV